MRRNVIKTYRMRILQNNKNKYKKTEDEMTKNIKIRKVKKFKTFVREQ